MAGAGVPLVQKIQNWQHATTLKSRNSCKLLGRKKLILLGLDKSWSILTNGRWYLLTYTNKGGRGTTLGNGCFASRYLSPISTVTSLLHKDFILRGSIGDSSTDQKDWLSFVNVKYQIYEAQRQGYTDDDIASSLMRSIHNDLPIKIIFEIKSNLSLATRMGYLQQHYEKRVPLTCVHSGPQ